MQSKLKVEVKHRKHPAHLSDDQVIDSLNAQGFADAWITPELIKAQRKILQAKVCQPYSGKSRHLIPGEFD